MVQAEKIRVGIVGAGSMAKAHAAAFGAIDEVQIEAICSRSKSKVENLATELNIPCAYTSIDAMFSKHKLDIVVIAVNITSTKEVCLECFHHPALFLIEKPLGMNLEEAYEIHKEAKCKQAQAYLAFNRRFYSSLRQIRNDLALIEGRRFIRIQDQEDLISAAKDGHPNAVLSNWMYANSIHLIDLISYYSRSQIKKISKVGSFATDRSTFSDYHVYIEFENGDAAAYEGIWNAQGPWGVTITTPDRRFECRPLESALYQNFPDRTRFEYTIDEVDRRFKPGFYLQAQHAVRAVKRQNHDLPDIDAGLETTKLVHQLFFQ